MIVILSLLTALARCGLQTYFYSQTVDHFNFQNTDAKYQQKYLVDDTFFTPNSSILFYTGNEAPIELFVNNTGWMFEIAPKLNAMVVFAEHRYYGASFPSTTQIHYLTVEQALADFVELIAYLRHGSSWQCQASPVIAFGGSYGGELSLFARMKQPNVFAGAIASSAPSVLHLLRDTNKFYQIVTDVYKNVSSTCSDLVRKGFVELQSKSQTAQGRQEIATAMQLCNVPSSPDDAMSLYGFVSDALETMAQYGYPYPSNFEGPMPGYPFRIACQEMLANKTPLRSLYSAVNVYFNYSGAAGPCFNAGFLLGKLERRTKRLSASARIAMSHLRRSGRAKSNSANVGASFDSWGYQTCTEEFYTFPSNGVTDFFLPSVPNVTQIYADCMSEWNVHPRASWQDPEHFFGSHIESLTNVVLSNGQLDPWRAGGISSCPKCHKSVVFLEIAQGAHHLDLRASNPLDPASVRHARAIELQQIQKWIAEWHNLYSKYS